MSILFKVLNNMGRKPKLTEEQIQMLIDDYLNTDMSLTKIGQKYNLTEPKIKIIIYNRIPKELIRKEKE